MQDLSTSTFRGENITIKELTVKQVRETFERLSHESELFIDDLLDQPVPAIIVCECTGLSTEQLEEGKPSELISLCREVLSVNPSLASMIKRRVEAATQLEQIIRSAKNLTVQSAA